MSDDSFIREVNEELRKDRFYAFWKKYRIFLLLSLLGLVTFGALQQSYEYFSYKKANEASLKLSSLLFAKSLSPEAEDLVQQLQEGGPGLYPVLATFQKAALLVQSEETTEALRLLDELANDASQPSLFRDVARFKMSYLLLPSEPFADMVTRLEPLNHAGHPLRFLATELLGYSAYLHADYPAATKLFEQLRTENEQDNALAQRVDIMLEELKNRHKDHA